jgi:hypothetical protein
MHRQSGSNTDKKQIADKKYCLGVPLTVLKLPEVSNLTFHRKAEYHVGILLGSNTDRQEITTNLNSNGKQITDQEYGLGVMLIGRKLSQILNNVK